MNLFSRINRLRRGSIGRLIKNRLNELSLNKSSGNDVLFSELCFCILAANFNAERSWRIQKEIGNGFSSLPEEKLAEELRRLGHRFPNARAKYIVEARRHKALLSKLVSSLSVEELRDWLVENVKGIGFKEASHFLRNIGFNNLAIIDFHILDFLERQGFIKETGLKTLSRRKYLEIEGVLKKISEKAGMSLGELDFYLWYLETGKVLK